MPEGEESSREAVLNGHHTGFLVLQAQRAASCRVYSQRQSWQKGPISAPEHRPVLSFRSPLKWRAGLHPGEKTNECSTTTEGFSLH